MADERKYSDTLLKFLGQITIKAYRTATRPEYHECFIQAQRDLKDVVLSDEEIRLARSILEERARETEREPLPGGFSGEGD